MTQILAEIGLSCVKLVRQRNFSLVQACCRTPFACPDKRRYGRFRPAISVQLAILEFKLMNEYFWYVGGHQLAHRDECKVSSNNDRKFLRPGLSTSCRLEATIRKIAVIITTLQQISALQAFDSSSSSCCCCRSWHFVQLCLFISFARGKDC